MSMSAAETSWGKRDALKAYNVRRWGIKYFDINNQGNVTVTPQKDRGGAIEIIHVVKEAERRGLRLPLLIRFQDLLRHRVESINEAFRRSISEFGYQGRYRGVFPIKVNQLREVVEEILDAGKPFDFGLEVGSKPELFAGLALQSGAEQPDHLQRLQGRASSAWRCSASSSARRSSWSSRSSRSCARSSASRAVRRRARSRHPRAAPCQGRAASGRPSGENAKFGLEHGRAAGGHRDAEGGEPGPLLQAAAFPHRLAGAGHSHHSKKAVQEAARFYAKLHKMGFPIEYLDVGGGLGVDYDGSRSAFDSSTNYTLQEYTNDIVYYDRRRLQHGEGAAPGHHQRERPRHRRPSQRADRARCSARSRRSDVPAVPQHVRAQRASRW